MPWHSPELEPLLTIAAAALDENGMLIEANGGFLRLITMEGPQPIGTRVAWFFIEPDFATLVRTQGGAGGESTVGC